MVAGLLTMMTHATSKGQVLEFITRLVDRFLYRHIQNCSTNTYNMQNRYSMFWSK